MLRPPEARQLVLGRHEQHVRIAQELSVSNGPSSERQHREREVEVAALDEPEQVVVGCGLGQLELDAGPGGQEAAHHAGEHLRADALEGPDP